jgi:hypothetical protein
MTNTKSEPEPQALIPPIGLDFSQLLLSRKCRLLRMRIGTISRLIRIPSKSRKSLSKMTMIEKELRLKIPIKSTLTKTLDQTFQINRQERKVLRWTLLRWPLVNRQLLTPKRMQSSGPERLKSSDRKQWRWSITQTPHSKRKLRLIQMTDLYIMMNHLKLNLIVWWAEKVISERIELMVHLQTNHQSCSTKIWDLKNEI